MLYARLLENKKPACAGVWNPDGALAFHGERYDTKSRGIVKGFSTAEEQQKKGVCD